MESENAIVTWCVGHLVTMSYPEVYDEKLKRWSLETLPFIPEEFRYEVIPAVAKQFRTVKSLLTRDDVDCIYVCTDSGREGEYIYRLVEQMSGVHGKKRLRVWIDSQTEDEILRGIREAKDLSAYDNLSASAYLRAKEDYLMGINFSRLLTLKYGNSIANFTGAKYTVLSVGRVMTCVLGMVVRREREIRNFVKTPFYRVLNTVSLDGRTFEGEWRAVKGSRYFQSFDLYKENGFKEKQKAEEFISWLKEETPLSCKVVSVEKKQEKKNPPLLYNLAELQNECAKRFKISPDETLKIVQELYEKKLVTYPRTDARVLSTAVAKEISKNLNGLSKYEMAKPYLQDILQFGSHKGLAKTRYVNDKQITDHYAIIPTGQGLSALNSVSHTAKQVYDVIVKRFLGIFYPPAIYRKIAIVTEMRGEMFFSSFKILEQEGYLKVAGKPLHKKEDKGEEEETELDSSFFEQIKILKKGSILPVQSLHIKEGETSPPKRYNSGSMILAMENAGQLIEDEELRAQIKGSGIGTSATRAEILKKLIHIKYLALNKKTQVITPTLLGEMVFDVVANSIKSLLNPELTASWEKGLTYVAEGEITPEEYMTKLRNFIISRTNGVLGLNNQYQLRRYYEQAAVFYKTGIHKKK
ncbi:DNA topoisomerase [Coprococcus sp. AF21-14LB]|uniref:DNA topoisomerase n=1 Tax=Coprococcus sp. AF21-14LB TaxID=2292231 RepID=UPI002E8E1AF2|nr:DNA topoisomerase [Coprococcus sp. AF21-14LB]